MQRPIAGAGSGTPGGRTNQRSFVEGTGGHRIQLTDSGASAGYRPGMLGDELRKERQKAGLTQKELSFRAGLDRTYISMLEHDKKSPTLDVLFRLCDALGVPVSRLIARVERERNAQK